MAKCIRRGIYVGLFISIFERIQSTRMGDPSYSHCAKACDRGRYWRILSLIALKNAKIVIASDATLVQLGDITSPGPLLAIASFFVIAALMYREVKSGVLISILMVTGIAWGLGL